MTISIAAAIRFIVVFPHHQLTDIATDRTYVCQIERSVINPLLLVLHKVAVALGVSVVDLLKSEDGQP